jgi:hypothetical protein
MADIRELVERLVRLGVDPSEAAVTVAEAFVEGSRSVLPVRSKGAERTARWRHKASQSVTGDVSSPLDDKGPQTPKNTKPPSKNPPQGGQKGSQKGTRLPDGTKVDWNATWRNWCLSAADRGPPKGVTLVSPTLENGSEVAGQVFVQQDTPQWDAWTRYRGRPPPTDRRGGWLLPSEWPPELEVSGCNQSEKPEEGLRH